MDNESENGPLRVLSLSGGGIRGAYTASVLAQFESFLAEDGPSESPRIVDYFDVITGTSIGGILALGLAFGKSARELKDLLKEHGQLIFPPMPTWKQLLRKTWAPVHSAGPLRELLEKIFQDARIGDLLKPVAIPSINYSTGVPKIFKTPHHPDLRVDYKEKLVDVALATSAAPTYFPVHEMGPSWYVDGGLIANSPSLIGYIEATKFLQSEGVHLLSIGTMGTHVSANQQKSPNKGYFFGWSLGKDLIELTLSANEKLHLDMTKILMSGKNDVFLSIDSHQTRNASEMMALDNASPGALNNLIAHGEHTGQIAFKVAKENGFFLSKTRLNIPFHYGHRTETTMREQK